MPELTPMKRQYQEIKSQYNDCLLFFRLGDFYEMFDEDAKTASKELDLTLTTRDRSVEDPEERTPMCGVPYHSAEAYIARLIAKGYKVAICEQTEDPALAKGLVKRDVIRIITPGTVTETSMLEEGKSNYLAAVYLAGREGGAAFCDVSTGEFCCAAFENDAVSHILNELGRFSPREALLSPGAAELAEIRDFVTKKLSAMPEEEGESFEYMPAAALVCEQFGFRDIDEAGIGDQPGAVCAAGALLSYIRRTQKCDMKHIRRLDVFFGGRFMELDYVTRRNLELTEALRSGEKKGSLLWVLDRTRTPMGGRLLRSWVERRSELRETLRGIGDMQRLVGKAVYGSAGGRDLRQLAVCAAQLPRLKELLQNSQCLELKDIGSPLLRARGRHPPPRLLRGGGQAPQRARQRGEDGAGSGDTGAGAHRHQKAEGRLQQGLRLLYRRAEVRGA